MIYDETSEVVEIASSEWIKLAELNIKNKDILRQRSIREQLRSMNRQKNVVYDEFFFDKAEKEKFDAMKLQNAFSEEEKQVLINEKKEYDEDNAYSFKKGDLKVHTLSVNDPMAHGLYVALENVRDINNQKQSDIEFDTHEIYLNKRNFKNSSLNIILSMNQNNEDQYDIVLKNKKDYRKYLNLKRYTEEITLSTYFYSFIYNNHNVNLMQVLKYFPKFERRKVNYENNM